MSEELIISHRWGYETNFCKMDPQLSECWPERCKVKASRSINARFEIDPNFLSRVILKIYWKSPSVVWDCQGVTRIDFLDKGRTITENYQTLLTTLVEQPMERRCEKISKVFCLCRTMPLYTNPMLQSKNNSWFNSSYSKDLTPSENHVFP